MTTEAASAGESDVNKSTAAEEGRDEDLIGGEASAPRQPANDAAGVVGAGTAKSAVPTKRAGTQRAGAEGAAAKGAARAAAAGLATSIVFGRVVCDEAGRSSGASAQIATHTACAGAVVGGAVAGHAAVVLGATRASSSSGQREAVGVRFTHARPGVARAHAASASTQHVAKARTALRLRGCGDPRAIHRDPK